MMSFKSWLRVCAMCSCGWGPKDLFCDNCWSQLWKQEKYRSGYFVTPQFSASVLWGWKDHGAVESMIRAQKNTGLIEAREKIFRRFLSFPLGEIPTQVVYVIPNGKKIDHASEGAEVLARYLGVPVVGLTIQPRKAYKSKGRNERLKESKIIGENRVKTTRNTWFYDDVITTGSTACSVWEYLGKPQGFQAVALVYRER